ncbi:MAG: FG-GAP-like repeat-containing protein [Bacteroidota bacterium]
MMKLKSLILLTMLLAGSIFAQDTFIRSAILDAPATYPSGFGATVAGVDLDGDGKLEIYSVDGMTDFMTGDEIPQIIKYELNGTSWDSVWAASLPDERQNTWAALTTGDLDGDGKPEIIWGYTESFSTNTTPDRITVFEVDGDDVLGISDGAGNFTPNTSWNMDVPESTSMRPLKWVAFDIDEDGKEEVVFAERRDHFNFGIISVDDVPDAGPGSETWTMEFNAKTELYNQFVRSSVIDGPDGGFGNLVTDLDLDGDGLMDLYAINDNWNDGPDGELIPTLYKYELVAGAFVLRWSTTIPGIDYQNTWPVLTSGDMDSDGLGEIIWCPINNFGAGNEDPSRIVVYEASADSAETIGIDNGDGTLSPNAEWNMGVPASTSMRPFRGYVTDIDSDGSQEFVFAERHAFYGWGVVSVSDIPDAGDGSETWTMEAAGSNLSASKNLNIAFEDDADIANWSHWNEGNVYTTEAHNATAGVGGTGALELGDGGYDFLAKRKIAPMSGNDYSLSVDIKTEGWGVPETYKLYLIVETFTSTDSVLINSDSGFTTFTLSGTATSDSGYIKIAGGNTAGQNYVWVDNLVFNVDDGSEALSNDYRDLAIIDQTAYLFDSDGGIVEITNDGTTYTEGARYQAYPGWSWLSANVVDVDSDGTEEIVTGDYLSGGSAGVWVLVPDADSLVGHQIADFTGNTGTRVTSVRAGYITADSLIDFAVGFRGTDEIYLVSYQGGDITADASYAVSLLDKGVLGADAIGQMDMMVVANIDGSGMDEVLYTGVPRSVGDNTQPLTVGSYSDTLTADATRRWDMVVANGKAHFFNGSGNLQSVYFEDGAYKLTKTQPGIVNGSFLSASATDVDNDGVEEIITGNWYDAKVNMLTWENGAWVAHEIADFTDVGGNRLNGGSVGDIDGDGMIDFVTGSRASIPNGQIYRVEYTGGDIADANSWSATVIDAEMNDQFTQYEVVHMANLDDDADLEVLYTSDYARGPAVGTPFPIVILDFQTLEFEPIADVRIDDNGDGIPDRDGQDVVVKGVVTSINSYSGSALLIAIQDESAGIWVYQSGNDSTHFAAGSQILVKGTLAQYRGLTEIYATEFFELGTATIPAPLVLTVDEYTSDGEKYEGSLLKINAVTKVEGETWPDSGGYGKTFDLTDGYKEFVAYLDQDVLDFEPGEPTWPVNLTFIAGQYSSSSTEYLDGYQASPRAFSDFEQGALAPPSPYFFFTDETKALDGGVLEISDPAADQVFSWHPAVDLNGDALIYQFAVLSPADGSDLVLEMSDNNGADTTFTVSGQDIIDIVALTGTDSLSVLLTLRTTSGVSGEGIIASVDTILVTLKDTYTDVNGESLIPKEFFVDQNYPNPFNPTTTIRFGLPSEAKVNLVIYDILGRVVTRLIDNQSMAAGFYNKHFDASRLASGAYIYRLQADQKVEVKKMLLLK